MLYCTRCHRLTNIALTHLEKGHEVKAVNMAMLNKLISENQSILSEVEFTAEALARVL
jgi:hypothetical protein